MNSIDSLILKHNDLVESRTIIDDCVSEFNYKANVVVNKYDDSTYEVLNFKKDFNIKRRCTKNNLIDVGDVTVYAPTGQILRAGHYSNKEIDRSRLFKIYNDTAIPCKYTQCETLKRYMISSRFSKKRAIDNMYGFTRSNDFKYFVTLTFDQKKFDSTDRKFVAVELNKFFKRLQYIDNRVKCLFILEYHKDQKHIHAHGLIGNIYLDNYLEQATHYLSGQPMIDKHGLNIFKSDLWGLGWNTWTQFDSSFNRIQICKYITKYITKSVCCDYGERAYFKTRNLQQRKKYCMSLNEIELDSLLKLSFINESNQREFVLDPNLILVDLRKDTERFSIYELKYNLLL